uniref:Uncharacterized protein n=1 Tax=Oryza sativa subsp. japonica TaxID=39947 RepID=Q10MM7_ORYSJ|nr:hypothetical protein LOC_Os03g19060 [Oryza sativa Japonica Group]
MALVYSESSLTGIQLIICKAARPGDQAQPNRKLPRNSSNLKTPKEFHATDPWGHMVRVYQLLLKGRDALMKLGITGKKYTQPARCYMIAFVLVYTNTINHLWLMPLALELPLPTAHWAKWCGCLRIDPLEYAVEMESVVAGAPDERAIVAGELTIRAAAVECHPAYTTGFILGVPCPRSHRMPLKNLDLHLGTWYTIREVDS